MSAQELTRLQVTVAHQNFEIPLHIFAPATGRHPGVLFLHDQWGLDEQARDAAERLAQLGYTVAVPDLFARAGAPADDSPVARQDFLFALSDSRITSDVLAVMSALARHEAVERRALGVIGWGWGGVYALTAGANDTRLRAVASIGGDVTYPVASANRTGSPLNFIADINGAIFAAFAENGAQPANEIRRLRERLAEQEKQGEVKVYTGTSEGFWREDSPQTELLWRRIQLFLAAAFTEAE
jgi:carboxymethylenebutenolidase